MWCWWRGCDKGKVFGGLGLAWWCFLVRNEMMRGLRWWVMRQPQVEGTDRQTVAWRSRLPGKSEAAGISPASSVQLPTSIIIISRRRRRDREIDTDDRSIYPPTLPS